MKTHGRTFTGTVLSAKMANTVTVEWTRVRFVTKYERYEKRRTRVKAHNPKEIDAKKGDIVRIMETKPISKTKHFIVIEKLGQAKLFETKQELMEEGRHRDQPKEEKEEPKEERA
ncbi:30S ribosomal protein S17 [Candidatus Woesearchaeota archaeon]|jgi:small subunit ribosomal protein S17|nr:30S ribosomal protein S17 [Candidatus Woesearchaeota archaeon]|tara:strand:- start:222 stop:566 length:345 start_codon:yes stop_codon:yes gene_type:complete